MTESHELWLRQIDAELDGELSLIERSALAKHLASCSHCSGARASQLEVRVVVPRPTIRGRALAFWVTLALLAGAAVGWLAYGRWGGPGSGSVEDARAAIVVP